MTVISPEERDLINRYLANRLSESEVTVVETRIVADPGFRNEVELTEALRDGLRELQSRGEITPLLSHRRSRWRHPRFALAASVAAIALGAASFLFYQRLDSRQRGDRHRVAALRAHAQRRWRTRRSSGSRPAYRRGCRCSSTSASSLRPGIASSVERMTDGAAVPVLETAATMTSDGQATIAAGSAQFEPGDYEITLRPQPPAGSREPVTYALRIVGPALTGLPSRNRAIDPLRQVGTDVLVRPRCRSGTAGRSSARWPASAPGTPSIATSAKGLAPFEVWLP